MASCCTTHCFSSRFSYTALHCTIGRFPGRAYTVPTFAPNQSVRLTKSLIDSLPLPCSGQRIYRDSVLRGFGIRISAKGARSFIIERRIGGRNRRITVGPFPVLGVEEARKQALGLLGKMALGLDPSEERVRSRLRGMTLEQVFAEFRKARKALKPRTLYDYARLMESAFGDWKGRRLKGLGRDMVLERHRALGEGHGPAYANLAMRFLRSLCNFAQVAWQNDKGEPLYPSNPVLKITQTRAWYPDRRRITVIKVSQIAPWVAAVESLRAEPSRFADTVADYLLILVFSGMRRNEAAQLTWNCVDLPGRALLIPDPKNSVPHQLPLSTPMQVILERRRRTAVNAFVFPGDGASGHLIEPRKHVHEVIRRSGVAFSLHDLRRTFITIAEGLDVSPYAIKRLVNHKMKNDVTAGYIISDVERLREPMERIAQFIVETASRPQAGNNVLPATPLALPAPRESA